MKIISIICLFFTLVLGAESDIARGAETNDVPPVGPLREFDRFTFEGNTTFSSWNLWCALNSTFDFPELSLPFAPRDVFLAAIGSQLYLGYEHCGFPDARIMARYDPKTDRVVVQIKEGSRYRCGPVEIIGARKISTQPIVTALTTTNADPGALQQTFQFLDNSPANRTAAADASDSDGQNYLWIAGQPAHFDDISLKLLSRKVTNTLGKLGFFLSQFSLNVVSNAAARTAFLQMKILEEGPPATVGRIDVVGNQRNSRKVLLDYVGLKPGMEFNSDLAATIQDRLYHSARFLTSSVLAGTPDSSGHLTLTIEVVENDQCPPLNGEFKPLEKTMLKARDWLAKVGETSDEAVLSVSRYSDGASTFQCILSPRQGLLMLENEVASGTNRLRHAVIMSARQMALYAPERQQKFAAHFSTSQFKSFINLETSAPEPNGNCAHLTFGAGISSLGDATNAPPYTLCMSLAPAVFVRLAHSTNSACWFDGNQLICSNSDSVLKLDARTGRFIELTAKSESTNHTLMSVRFEPDAFVSALTRIESEGGGFVNVYRTNAPLGSAVAFFGSELVQEKFVDSYLRTRLPVATCAQLPALLRQLETGDLFAPLQSFFDLQKEPDDPGAKFEILEELHPGPGGTFGSEIATCAQFILVRGDEMLPVRTWPWMLAREFAFLVHGQRDYLLRDLQDIYDSGETGPIGCLVTAQLLKSQNSPLAKAMAARGLERLSADDFRRDCRLFLDENKLCGRWAAVLAVTVRNLNEQELNALMEPVPAPLADFIRDCVPRLRAAKKDQPLVETIAPALDAFWGKELKRNIADRLKKIANE
jgi:predicted DCC family thiol-disulfide oxidoreductase YuxK